MDAIRIQHLRCLTDTGEIALKPLTVLLGQNSSGKSTFLRFFPLLKQSVEMRTSGPILWYGRLVDFGTYQEAKQRESEEDIIFSFKFPCSSFSIGDVHLSIKLAKNPRNEFTFTRQFNLEMLGHKFTITFNDEQEIESFRFDQVEMLSEKYPHFNFNKSNSLFPNLQEYELRKFFEGKIKEKIQKICNHQLSDQEFRDFYSRISPYQEDAKKRILSYINDVKILKKYTKDWDINTPELQEIYELLLMFDLPYIIPSFKKRLQTFSKQVRYIAPLRFLPERYERIRDLQTDELDPRGENLAMFIYNLSNEDFQNFQEWTMINFDFDLRLVKNAGLVSLEIRTKESEQFINIVDVGSGFSQLLPVIAQLWYISEFKPIIYTTQFGISGQGNLVINNPPKNAKLSIDNDLRLPFIFAIEQPELHLHPRLQGILTDVLVKAIKTAKDNDIDLRLVIETHSKVLVNRLGQLIDKGSISSDDINLVLFELSDDPQKVNVRTTQFNESGYINHWPLGFLDMDLDLDVD